MFVRSNKLWDMFIKWEGEKSPRNVMKLYDRLLLIPTAQYTTLMQSFKEFVNDNNPKNFLDVDEFIGFRTEVVKELRAAQGLDPEVPSATAGDTPPGDDAPPGDLVKEEAASDEETKGIREKLIANRAKVFEKLETEVKKRLHFEEALKRPYFHVKPLEKGQLKTWREYLDFEIKEGNADRIRVLFERCFIACALYEEFWLKYIDYLRSQKAADDVVSAVFERTCRVHLKRKLSINLQWSLFEETTGNFDKAMEVLDHLEGNFGLSLAIAMRKISLARRAKKMHEVEALFHNYIEKLIKKGDRAQADAVVIKLARFVDKVLKDRSKTREIMEKAIESSPGNPRMYMYMIDFFAEEGPERTPEILAVFEKAEKSELPNDIKLMFMHRKMEYMEDFGDQIIEAEKAFEDYASFVKKAKEDRKRGHDDGYEYDATGAKKAKTDATSSSISVRASTGATGPYQYGSYSQPAGSTSAAQYNQAYPYSYGTAYQQPQQGAWNYGGAAAAAAAAAAAGGQYAGYTSQQGWQNGYSYYGQR
ncbi:unnamed protein product [Notodromas monacha]|uniref:Pre-mRNA-processing factor 39 n=1 Tax=Notodromas monacha TaxID=399045 RepID=A0A7R9GA83_9CRUS|nr:unnamed protein product [Notodromas monacha]CAG0913729.1 unnamed protein product [Notodromas monacha]